MDGWNAWDALIIEKHAASYLQVFPVSPCQAAEAALDRKKLNTAQYLKTIG